MLAPFEDLSGEGDADGIYDVEVMLLGNTENLKTYKLKRGDTLTLNIKADDGYILPNDIDVDGAEHTWVKSSYSEGILTLSKASKNVDVTIRAIDFVSLDVDDNRQEIYNSYEIAIDVNARDLFIQRDTISLSGGEVEYYLGSTFTISSIDCDEGLSATWRVDDNGVTVVTYIYDGTIPEDGVLNAYVHIVKVDTVSLSLESCYVSGSNIS